MKSLIWIDRALAKIEGWAIIFFLWIMVILTFFQVCLRGLYTHGRLSWANELIGGLDWSEPLVRLLVLWLSFLGASLLTRDNRHIKIDLFSGILSARWIPLRELLLCMACVMVSGIMVKVCIEYLLLEMAFGGRQLLGLPNWVAQLILPVGFAVIFFRFLIKTIQEGTNLMQGWKQ